MARFGPLPTSLFFLLTLSALSYSASPESKDHLENLIDKEKSDQSAWTKEEGDLPPLNLPGDQNGVLAYQAGLERGGESQLCSDVEFDELLETPAAGQTVAINTNLPRVRESLQEHCLIRPGDPLLAIGPGWQEMVTVKGFEARPDKAHCPNDPDTSLWLTFDGSLPEAPYFFTTNLELPAEPNKFSAVADWKTEALTPLLRKRIAPEVSFIDEYDGRVYRLGLPGCDRLIHLTKRKVSSEDNDLPNEVLLAEKDGSVQVLLIERVDLTKGSGHLRPIGTIDMDHDANRELILEGDHQGCPYQAVFRGQDFGFERISIPVFSCSCD